MTGTVGDNAVGGAVWESRSLDNLQGSFLLSELPVEAEVQAAVFGNVGTMLLFRVGPLDGRLILKLFSPEFEELDLDNLPNHNVVVRLMVGGEPVRSFSARTLPPLWRARG